MRITALTIAAALMATPAVVSAADQTPAARIGAYDDAVIAIMKQHLPMKARVARFHLLVDDYYDMAAIAQIVAGPAWAKAPEVDRTALADALAHHSAVQLAQNFARYGGERFIVDPAVQMRGDSAIVKVTIQSGGSPTILYYRLHQSGRGWTIIDVMSGGVSQLAVQRADLASTASGSGGLGAVVRKLAAIDARTVASR